MLRLARGSLAAAALLLFAITAALSMWISNTAAAAMMVRLAPGLLNSRTRKPDARSSVFLLLGLACAAGIGGIGTLVGIPPNAIVAAQAGISFAEWLRLGLPIVALLLPSLSGRIEPPSMAIEWTTGRWTALLVFALTVAGGGWGARPCPPRSASAVVSIRWWRSARSSRFA